MFDYLASGKIFLHWYWTALFGITSAVWIILGSRALRGMSRVPHIAGVSPAADADCPSVSILFAARDEAEKLSAALATLLAQDYPRFEIVAVNDRSQDATPAILDHAARASDGLTVVHVSELPPGWLGKPHALQQAYEHSHGDWLVFTDADVHFAPDLLRRAVALAHERGWDHLTLITDIDVRGFWEKVTVCYFGLAFVLGTQPWLASNTRSRFYVGVGAFQLLRRSAYEAIGMHRRLAMEVIDDMKLGKLVKLGGFRSGLAFGGPLLRVRWQSGTRNMVRGVTKNMFAACDYSFTKAVVAALGMFGLGVLPVFGLAFAGGWARVLAGAALAAGIAAHARLLRGSRASPLYGFTLPLGAAIFCWMIARSAAVTLWRGGVVWRDTFYPLDDLRRGMV